MSAVNFHDQVYTFGGRGQRKTSDVFVFNTVWTKHKPGLRASRYGHRSFVAGNTIFHFGGSYGDDGEDLLRK